MGKSGLRMSENRVLRKEYGPKKEYETAAWR
jgi:hypothetical protein